MTGQDDSTGNWIAAVCLTAVLAGAVGFFAGASSVEATIKVEVVREVPVLTSIKDDEAISPSSSLDRIRLSYIATRKIAGFAEMLKGDTPMDKLVRPYLLAQMTLAFDLFDKRANAAIADQAIPERFRTPMQEGQLQMRQLAERVLTEEALTLARREQVTAEQAISRELRAK